MEEDDEEGDEIGEPESLHTQVRRKRREWRQEGWSLTVRVIPVGGLR